jgi:hypothetical protein
VGQVNRVNIKYLLCKGTLDDVMWKTVQDKTQVVGKAIQGASTAIETTEVSRLQPPVTADAFKQSPFGGDASAAAAAASSWSGRSESTASSQVMFSSAGPAAGAPVTPQVWQAGAGFLVEEVEVEDDEDEVVMETAPRRLTPPAPIAKAVGEPKRALKQVENTQQLGAKKPKAVIVVDDDEDDEEFQALLWRPCPFCQKMVAIDDEIHTNVCNLDWS